VLVLTDSVENIGKQIQHARELSRSVMIEVSGNVTLDNVRAYAEVGADLIRVHALTQSVRAMPISFQIQPG
jgi:nicotinate-nucleotide pyrophosphorylase (carboxylating)